MNSPFCLLHLRRQSRRWCLKNWERYSSTRLTHCRSRDAGLISPLQGRLIWFQTAKQTLVQPTSLLFQGLARFEIDLIDITQMVSSILWLRKILNVTRLSTFKALWNSSSPSWLLHSQDALMLPSSPVDRRGLQAFHLKSLETNSQKAR